MKKLLIILFCFPLMVFSQEEKQPNLYEVVDIKVKAGQEEAFEAAVKAHDEKFHAEGKYEAHLYYVVNGPKGGSYSWIMGPTSWTALDDRPGEGTHEDDWGDVNDYVESYGGVSYWSVSGKLSHPNDNDANVKSRLWMYDIKRGQGARWAELMGKITKVYNEKRPDDHMHVAWNEFANSNAGADAVIVWEFEKWAWLDRESKFPQEYEEVHGAGSWHNFLNEFSETTNGRVDWIREQVH